jgi:hypothetical protein
MAEIILQSGNEELHLEIFSLVFLALIPGVLGCIIVPDGICNSVRFASHKPSEGFNISGEVIVHSFTEPLG